MTDFDFDTSVEGAWRAFRTDLADQLADLAVGAELTVAQSREFPEGPHGVLTFSVTRARRVRCTAHVLDLHPTVEFKLEQLDTMVGAGWRLLRDNRLIYEVGQRRVDKLAQVAVDTLRAIWEVVHPSFLDGATPMPTEASVAVGAIPDNREHLVRLVIGALEEMAGRRIAIDEDGDIPLPTGEKPSWLRVLNEDASIEFFGTLIDQVPDVATASEYIAAEAVRWPGVKLVLHQSTLMAFFSVEMSAFHRENLVSSLGKWLQFMHEAAPEIISALTGVESIEPTPEDDRLPDPLQTLIVLDEDGQTLDAHEVATICRHDQSAILRYIHTTQEQYLSWMKSAYEADAVGDAEEAAACRHEENVWRLTTHKLREALRIVVLSDDDGITDRNPRPTTR